MRQVCESLGLEKVETVISSGNVVFEAASDDPAALEAELEAAWRERLGFESPTILRSWDDLARLVAMEPLGDREHGPETYLLTTFGKSGPSHEWEFPFQPVGKDFWVVAGTDDEIFTVIDTVHTKTPYVMAWVETQFGKEITSRRWLTVSRILERMG